MGDPFLLFCDECLNEQWFLNLAHAQTIIEAWRCEYYEERPKKVLGGFMPRARKFLVKFMPAEDTDQ